MTPLSDSLGWRMAGLVSLVFCFLVTLGLFFLFNINLTGINWVQLIIGAVLFLTLLTGGLVYGGYRFFVSTPLQRVIETMKMAEGGNLTVRTSEYSVGAVGAVQGELNRLLASLALLDRIKLPQIQGPITRKKVKVDAEEKTEIIRKTNIKLENNFDDLTAFYRVTDGISQALELSELVHMAAKTLSESLSYARFSLIFLNEQKSIYEVRVAHGFDNDVKLLGQEILLGAGITGRAIKSGKRQFLRHFLGTQDFLHQRDEVRSQLHYMSIPMIVKGMVVGVMNIGSADKEFFDSSHVKFLESLASQMATAYHRSQLYEKTKELAITDELTGLNNRRHFQRMLQNEWKRAIRFDRPLSLLMIDVDHFKRVNDGYGHLNGDQVLKQIAQLLLGHVREVDTVARFGGEEFTILLTDTPYHDALKVAEKLRHITETKARFICEPLGITLPLTISIGVSNYPRCASASEELINTADIALYEAKHQGRNRVQGFAKAIHLAPVKGLKTFSHINKGA